MPKKSFGWLWCEKLKKDAPGIDYNASMIARLTVADPWKDEGYHLITPIELWLCQLKQCSGNIIEAWTT
jgi:hypothetical protein